MDAVITVLGLSRRSLRFTTKRFKKVKSLANVPDDLTRHMDYQVQKGAKRHRQESCAFCFVLRSVARGNRQQESGLRFRPCC